MYLIDLNLNRVVSKLASCTANQTALQMVGTAITSSGMFSLVKSFREVFEGRIHIIILQHSVQYNTEYNTDNSHGFLQNRNLKWEDINNNNTPKNNNQNNTIHQMFWACLSVS